MKIAASMLMVLRRTFTAKERDPETGLDWLEHRYLSSAQGRFTSPDPVFANVHRLFDPQQWNLYAYVRNNPLSLTDPTGLDFYQTCTHSDSNGSTCHEVQNGSAKTWVTGTTDSKGNFTANRIANDADGNLVDVAHGNAAVTGTFDQRGVHLNGSNGQFIEGSNATKIGGSGTFAGINGNFFSACGGSCQARGTLTGTADAFTHMKAGLVQQGSFKSFLDGFSGAHPFQTTQWKDAGGYVHLIKAPGLHHGHAFRRQVHGRWLGAVYTALRRHDQRPSERSRCEAEGHDDTWKGP